MPPLQVRCVGRSALVGVLGIFVRGNGGSGVIVEFVPLSIGIPRGRDGNFSESERDSDVPASKMHMFDGMMVSAGTICVG